MNITLSPEFEALINEKVKSGLYNSPSEVVREGLQLLKEQDQLKELRRTELRAEIQKGIDDIRAGRCVKLETTEEFDNFANRIKEEARELLASGNGSV